MLYCEVDLDRHLENESEQDSVDFSSEVSAADDYAMYQALILLKGASILSGQQSQQQ